MSAESPKAIFYALAANTGIAVCKYAAAAFTGSGSMFAEAIHSTADCGNQLLLLFGLRQSREPPSPLHPMGSGRAINFYSLLVALLLFFVGGAFSVYEGVHRLFTREPLQYVYVALAVLGVSVVLEALSLYGAMREIRAGNPGKPLWRWFRETRDSDLLVVAGEDVAALAGLAIAFVAVLLTVITGNPVWDACGSICIGFLLMTIAWLVAREVKSMIVGESASPEMRRDIETFLRARPEIRHIMNVITLQWGKEIVVAVQAEMIDYEHSRTMVEAINEIEADLQARFPQVRWVFFEPDFVNR
ncbi:cation diffusion facilitator family transporter [Paraburkholderia tropica]|uniref:cation diffusion facilitator family transporter n=1 Tax=Paraburkholderia tropica TaxID=92647 RepID=UPI002AB30CC5|nr:cation diffusion facilitator family transporter [Paraburkholderia tropica]